MKKVIAFILSVTMLAGILAGCGQGGVSSSAPSSSAPPSSAAAPSSSGAASSEAPQSTMVSEKPLELSFFVSSGTADVTTSLNMDMPVMQYIKEKTNVSFKFTTGTKAEIEEKFPLMMADPNSITDIVATHISKRWGITFGQQGAFIPLQDMMPNYPNIKKYICDNPAVMGDITDPYGNIYFIPGLSAHDVGEVWYIREDWLKKLDLKIPATIEELEEVLMAFKTQDPNGNGKADEVPWGQIAKTDLRALAWPFGIDDRWYITDAGVPEYGPTNPVYKDYIEMMARFYSNGLIDQEYLTRTGNKRDYFLTGDLSGLVHSFAGATGRYNDSAPLNGASPDFKLIPVAPFTGPTGKIVDRSTAGKLSEYGWSISVNNKHVEETMRLIDWMLSDEATVLLNFGIEGLSYETVNGEPVYKMDFFKTGLINLDELMAIGGQPNFPKRVDIRYEDQTTNEVYNLAKDMYEGKGYLAPTFPALQFTTEEQKVIDKYEKQMNDYIEENTAKWISGQQPLDNFDAYLDTLKTSFGLEELNAAYKAAHERYLAAGK